MTSREEDDFDLNLGRPGNFQDNYEDNGVQHDLTKFLRESPRYYDPKRFESLWSSIHDGKTPIVDPNFVKAQMDANYETGRFYHNQSHIESLLEGFDELKEREIIVNPKEFELAIYAHDVIYDTKAKDNEIQSARWISEILKRSGVKRWKKEKVRSLIIASDHKSNPEDDDLKYFIDLDLSIFGKPKKEYDKYSESIRKEYFWVQEEDYRMGRSQVLRHFLAREHIYYTDFFRKRYESIARTNLEKELQTLD